MKELIILPGNSLKNKEWGEAMLEHYSSWFASAFMLAYDHWESGTGWIDMAAEEAKLKAHVAGLPADAEVVVLAKSVGSLLALVAIQHGTAAPSKCVFFGMPLDMAAEGMFKDDWSALDSLSVPAMAFHNEDDPTTSFAFTQSALAEHAPSITFVPTKGDNHWYDNADVYDTYLEQFLLGE